MKKLLVVLGVTLVLFGAWFSMAADEYTIPKHPWTDDVVWAPAIPYEEWQGWSLPKKYGFVSGFISGLLFSFGRDYFEKVGGMTHQQVMDTIEKFYKDYPHFRDRYSVIDVIWKVIPRYRSGQKPIDR